MNFSRRAFATGSLTLGAAVMAGLPAFAQNNLSAADRETVQRVSAWFQGVRAARGSFVETGPGGRRAEGRYFIQRPGKMRFEYSNPEGLLVVADGNNLMRYDPRLEVFRQAPLSATPLSVFLGRNVRIEEGVRIDRVTRMDSGAFAVVARDADRPNEGQVILAFAGSPARLMEWTVIDPQGRRTRTQLSSFEAVNSLPNSLFTLRDPTRRPGRN